jgi:hypothetical protein
MMNGSVGGSASPKSSIELSKMLNKFIGFRAVHSASQCCISETVFRIEPSYRGSSNWIVAIGGA